MKRKSEENVSIPPMGIRMLAREFKKDKLAMFSLIILIVLLLVAFIGPFFLDGETVTAVNPLDRYLKPGEMSIDGRTFLLGSDDGGRDVFGLLLIGTAIPFLLVLLLLLLPLLSVWV